MAKAPRYGTPKPLERYLDDLVDAETAAEMLGLTTGPSSIRVYKLRYGDEFPDPVWVSRSGRCRAWYRPHLEAFLARHAGSKGREKDGDVTPPS